MQIYLDKFPVSCFISSTGRGGFGSSTELKRQDRNLRLVLVIAGVAVFSESGSCSRNGGRWANSGSSISSLITMSDLQKLKTTKIITTMDTSNAFIID